MPRLFLLTWNPERFKMDWEEESAHWLDSSGSWRWSTGSRKRGVSPGDRFLLLRQVSKRGIVASGVAAGEIFQDDHWEPERDDMANYVDVAWEDTVTVEERLPIEDLKRIAPDAEWTPQGSGTQVPEPDASVVWNAWRSHLDDAVPAARGARPAEEVGSNEQVREGAKTRIMVNRYERSASARQACLNAHGTACTVCGFDFGERYGDLGEGFIHVHHLVDLSTIGKEYEIDGAEDLRPVCPNCHAMLHRERPALTLDNLRKQLN